MPEEEHPPLCVLDEDCPLRMMFDLVGDRWTSSVLFVIGDGVKRYSDLQRQIPGVSKATFTAQSAVPLVLEAFGVALAGFLVGAFLAYLIEAHRRYNAQWSW